MHNKNALKKGIIISLMAVSLLFSFTSVSLADEKGGSMGGMDMGGSSTTQTAPVEKNVQDSQSMTTQPQASDPNATSGHEEKPGMDPDMEGMQEPSSGGHSESSETSEGVNWIIVGGFLVINVLILIIASVLKSSKKVQPQL